VSIKDEIIGTAGRKSEKLLAKRLGARLTPASGAANAKGDMRREGWLIEAKSTVSGSMSLSYAWLSKIMGEAMAAGRKPALAITFTDREGRPVSRGSWVMIPEIEYQSLMEGQDRESRNQND
jgi:hypothetical protein